MEIKKKQASVKGPPELFTGDAWFDLIARGDGPSRMRATIVRFAPGARMAWHSHAIDQTLFITEGAGLVQSRGSEVLHVHAGDIVHTPPNEWHWHGATPTDFMTHFSVTEGVGEDSDTPESEWGALVTDAEYRGEGA